MMLKILRFTRPGHLPFILGFSFLIFAFIYQIAGLPRPAELAEIGRNLYLKYGIIILLIAAFIEGIFMVNFYFPGSFVIVLAVFLSEKAVKALATIALLSLVGFLVATVVNYVLGKYGFYRVLLWMGRKDTVENMQKWLDKRGRVAVFLAAFHPNSLAIAVVCMGIAREGVFKTGVVAASSLIFWVSIWTVITATVVSRVNIEDPNQHWYIFAAFILWGLFLIAKEQVQQVKRKTQT